METKVISAITWDVRYPKVSVCGRPYLNYLNSVVFQKKWVPSWILVKSAPGLGVWSSLKRLIFVTSRENAIITCKVGPYDRYKWNYNLYKWPKINRQLEYITPFITDRGPPCETTPKIGETRNITKGQTLPGHFWRSRFSQCNGWSLWWTPLLSHLCIGMATKKTQPLRAIKQKLKFAPLFLLDMYLEVQDI